MPWRALSGKVVLMVNVASHCGLTHVNYAQLNQLHNRHNAAGLEIAAFPCNTFHQAHQRLLLPSLMRDAWFEEYDNAPTIAAFAQRKGVAFDLYEKVEVNGPRTHPLWDFLKDSQKGAWGNRSPTLPSPASLQRADQVQGRDVELRQVPRGPQRPRRQALRPRRPPTRPPFLPHPPAPTQCRGPPLQSIEKDILRELNRA